jgi:hypothetical protein
MTSRHMCAAALSIILACGGALADPQATKETSTAPPDPQQATATDQSTMPTKAKKRGEFTFAPIPVIDPTLGNGMALGVLYTVRLQKEDRVSPPSVFGLGGFRTSTGSWGLAGGGQLFLKQDRYRILAVGATARVSYNFYGLGSESSASSIPITQNGGGLLVGGLVRTFGRWFVGGRYYYFKVNTSLGNKDSETPDAIREVELRIPVAALGLHIQRDTRESQFYARTGSVLDTKAYTSNKSVGALFTYQDYETAFQQYFKLGEKQVLAYRVKGCAVNGHAPFFAVCSLGNSADLRGYPSGRYRDRRMLVGQAEFRREIWWRFGLNAFAGMGEVARTFGDFTSSAIRPGAGVGARFTVSPKNHINLRVDYGIGRGSHAWYVGIGEAF